MVLPQFSLRMVLGLVAVLAFVSLIISRGLQGSAWAMGVSVALLALVFVFSMYAVFFGAIYLVSLAFNLRAALQPQRAEVALPATRALPTVPRDNTEFVPPPLDST
jgi:uncharacterized membrane protein